MDEDREEWKPVEGYSGRYIVSSYGRVARLMKARVATNGYRCVSLSENWKTKAIALHQVIAEVFLGPAFGRWIHHRDNDKTNNRPHNLEYVTPKENTRRAFADGLIGVREDHHSAKLTWDDVYQIRELCAIGELSQREIGEMFSVSQGTVGSIHHEKIWKTGGPNGTPTPVLTRRQVGEIKSLLKSNTPLDWIAKDYGVAIQLIRNIMNEECWKHVSAIPDIGG